MPMGNLQHLETVLLRPSLYVAVKSLLLNTAHDPRLTQEFFDIDAALFSRWGVCVVS